MKFKIITTCEGKEEIASVALVPRASSQIRGFGSAVV